MKNIRHGIFETNSSSSHSISIAHGSIGIFDTITPIKGKITLTGGEFGCEWRKYNSSEVKANYSAVFARDNKIMTDMLEQVLKEHTGANQITFDLGESYIDHQSALSENGDARKAFDTPTTLKSWIFNPDSWLFTGNDNECAPPNFYDVEFGIEYLYILEVDGCRVSEKFEDKPNQESLENSLRKIMDHHPLCHINKDFFEVINEYRKFHDKKVYNSFAKINDGLVTVFKTEEVTSGKGRDKDYLGDIVVESRDIKFALKKI